MKALIAIDDTAHAEQTLAAVGEWANTWGVEVALLTLVKPGTATDTLASHDYSHALTPAGMPSGHALHVAEPLPRLAETRGQALSRKETEAQERLLALAEEYLPLAPATAYAQMAENLAPAIIAKAQQVGADLIVMGTHGRTGLSHLIGGSVAEGVIRDAPMPVLVVGPRVGQRAAVAR
jgi:nucleotide-binding universal stress UspA family protein